MPLQLPRKILLSATAGAAKIQPPVSYSQTVRPTAPGSSGTASRAKLKTAGSAPECSRRRRPLGLRFLRRFRLVGTVEGDRPENERLEGGLVDDVSLVDVDRAAYVSFETRVEEMGRILQRRALGEGELHDILVDRKSTRLNSSH